MIYIISGPSSVGKSTFLGSPKLSELTGVSNISPIIFPADIQKQEDVIKPNCFIHFNILRCANTVFKASGEIGSSYTNFETDGPWLEILRSPFPKKAFVLLASRTELMNRIARRDFVEPAIIAGKQSGEYPKQHWTELLENINLDELNKSWCQELEENKIPYTLINSSKGCFSVVQNLEGFVF